MELVYKYLTSLTRRFFGSLLLIQALLSEGGTAAVAAYTPGPQAVVTWVAGTAVNVVLTAEVGIWHIARMKVREEIDEEA